MNEITKGDFTLSIHQDIDGGGDSPREWDNVGSLITVGGSSHLADKDLGFSDPEDSLRHLLELAGIDKDLEEFGEPSFERHDRVIEAIKGKVLVFKVDKYEHGGISLSLKPHNIAFDSGQTGFMYVTREKLEEEMKGKTDEEVYEQLSLELKTYNQYLNGEVYGFMVYDNRLDETVDSCWGFYGEPEDILKEVQEDHVGLTALAERRQAKLGELAPLEKEEEELRQALVEKRQEIRAMLED